MEPGRIASSVTDTLARELLLVAPLDGWATPLSQIADAVFASKMLGDGVAVDPLSATLASPCDGEVLMLHAARHALTLRAACGAEILLHIGLDTVALAGDGFTAHVRLGERVKAGEPLISFDLDRLGEKATSLIVPIVIANGEGFTIAWRQENAAVKQGAPLMRVKPLGTVRAATAEGQEIRRALILTLPHGLHARPAARIAALAKAFACEIFIACGQKRANATSPASILGLGLTHGAELTLTARGENAAEAVAAIVRLIESGMQEKAAETTEIYSAPGQSVTPAKWRGVRAAPGIATGIATRLARTPMAVEEQGGNAVCETQRLEHALQVARERLRRVSASDGKQSEVLAAHIAFLDDPELLAHANRTIAEGKSAGFAWRDAIANQIAVLKGLGLPRFAERAADLADLERQVLMALEGAQHEPIDLPENAILLAEDLLLSEFAALDLNRLSGIALANSGPTSHVAILSQDAGIPMLVACGPDILSIDIGSVLCLDADQGRIVLDSDAALFRRAQRENAAGRRNPTRPQTQTPGATADGQRVEICANLGSVEDARSAMAFGAEGCGLLRTEFLFLNREAPPSEAEQSKVYKAIAEVLAGKPLVIRTLDIGGDKAAPYLPFPTEENPALGLRGVRVSLSRPDLLTVQLRAIIAAVRPSQCRIMVPMVASLSEFEEVRRMLDHARAELRISDPISLGVMVETPAAAITADLLSAHADFLSIGTNDLTQYCLAMDRGSARLADSFDALHPAVLRLIATAVEGARRHSRAVSVCGGLASEPLAAPILVGLGVRGLSAAPSQIPAIKARLARVTLDQCQRITRAALSLPAAADVRALARSLGEY